MQLLKNQSSYVTAYYEQNVTLARTLTIKSDTTAELVNQKVIEDHGNLAVDASDKTTWKYYLNVCGEYHPTDRPMEIISLDNLQTIVLSKANLAIHGATRAAYTYGSRYYYALLERYPEQQHLIISILHPAEMAHAVSAENGAVLSYAKDLVEEQEQTLIPELEDSIKRHMFRWDVNAFGISDEYYNIAYQYILHNFVLMKLLNLRLSRAKTNEAHSFHIREYLASHGRLDRYLPYLSLKQALWLYRNILYIERNSGSTEQFDVLIKKILNERNIPISEYSIRQLTSFDGQHFPNIIARAKAIGVNANLSELEYIPIEELYRKEEKLVYGNELYYQGNEENDTYRLKTSNSNVIQTKDLESSMIDYSDAFPDKLVDILMRQWLAMAYHGHYTIQVNYKDPKTSVNRSLSSLDAFIYLNYATLQLNGIVAETVPDYINLKYRLNTKATEAEMLSVVDPLAGDLSGTARYLYQQQPEMRIINSTNDFFTFTYGIFEESKRHWYLTSNAADLYQQASIKNMILRMYGDAWIQFPEAGTSMSTWLMDRDLGLWNYTKEEAISLIAEIFQNATGLVVDDTKVLKHIQRALISLFTELSSYSIQVITQTNDDAIIPLNWSSTRIGDLKNDVSSENYIPVEVTVLEQFGDSSHRLEIQRGNSDIIGKSEYIEDYYIPVKIDASAISLETAYKHFDVYQNRIGLSVSYVGENFNQRGSSILVGAEQFNVLDAVDKNLIKTIYRNRN